MDMSPRQLSAWPVPPLPRRPNEVLSSYQATQGTTSQSPGEGVVGRLAAVSGCVRASPEAPMPARSRPKSSESIRGRTSEWGGVEFDVDKHAGSRSMPMPTGNSVNRMKIVGA